MATGDHQALRPAPVRRAAEKMDRGAHLGLDQPLSSAGTRLRASRSQGGRVRPSRNDPSHAPAPRLNVLIRNRNFPERWGDWGLGLKAADPFGMLDRGPC